MSATLARPAVDFDRLRWRSFAVGAAALVVCAVGAFFGPVPFFRAYLAAYLYFLGVALGCLAILMVYHLTGGAWGYLIRRFLEVGVRTLPLLTVLFLPLAFGLGYLYVWARPAEVAASPDLQWKRPYLNPTFWWVRAALYFIAWNGLAYAHLSWSQRQEESGDPQPARRLAYLSGPGLLVYGLTITFAAVDWVMSLEPAFRSTVFGPLVASSQVLSGHAFAVLLLALLVGYPASARVAPDALNDLGNLLLTFVVIWTYLAYFQYMLIWIANLPYEVIWYLPRERGGWLWVGRALALFGFAVPFFLLLSRDVKRHPPALAAVAGLAAFTQLVFSYYQVLPAFETRALAEHWIDFVTPVGVGGVWLSGVLGGLSRGPLLPLHDPNRAWAVLPDGRFPEPLPRAEEVHHG
jgi:hypothetical protein